MRRIPRCLRVLVMTAMAIAVLVPAIAWAQDDSAPSMPTAVIVEQILALNLDGDPSSGGPDTMLLTSALFSTSIDAASAFLPALESIHKGRSRDGQGQFVSVGKLGNDRAALLTEASSGETTLDVLVRLDSMLLFVEASRLGSGGVQFVADYLGGLLAVRAGSPGGSLLPDVSELPIGWALAYSEPLVLPSRTSVAEVEATRATPVITETPLASEAANDLPTLIAYQTQVAQLEATVTAVQQELADADATSEALAVQVAAQSLNPNSVQETITVNLSGVVSGNVSDVEDARQQLDQVFQKYTDGSNCQIGFALISSRASDIGSGIQLSNAIADLISDEFPGLLPVNADGSRGRLISESIVLPGTTPVGEVQLQLFFNSGCTPTG